MSRFDRYKNAYRNIRLERDDRGVLEVHFHTNSGPLRWGHAGGAHEEFTDAFAELARDSSNRIIIMTGTGDEFSGPPADQSAVPTGATTWEQLRRDAIVLTKSLLDIPVPVISCLNGPAYRHSEIALLGDIVLAAPDALVQDSAHFVNGLVPGDGCNIVFPLLLGFNRGRSFLLRGEKIYADELLRLGVVSEVLPREQLLTRARELAAELGKQSTSVLRYSREVITVALRDQLDRFLWPSITLEMLAAVQDKGLNESA
jgi:enoyl-CoA hydratase/carnithine racemase